MFRRILLPVLLLLISAGAAPAQEEKEDTTCDPALIEAAKARVHEVLPWRADPWFICLKSQTGRMKNYAGLAVKLPFAEPAIVLAPGFQTIDIAAHEYAHAALTVPVGGAMILRRFPAWLNEGLAMQFDYRRDYSRAMIDRLKTPQNADSLALRSMLTHTGFQGTGNPQIRYAFAKCVVGMWFRDQGQDYVIRFVDEFSSFAPFPYGEFAGYAEGCGGSV